MFEIRDEAQKATVYIYGTIGDDWWSPEDANRAKDFAQTLDALSPKPLDIRIDSAGGDVYEGFAIASAIQRYEGPTHALVDGLAASAASYIALMADEVTMNDYAMIMIHNAWTYASGNKGELLDVAERLDALDKTIAGIISSRSGLSLDETLAAMDAETWYTGAAALEAGMCDEVVETEQRMTASIDPRMKAHIRRLPENVAFAPASPCPEPCAETTGQEPETDEADAKSHAANTLSRNEAGDTSEVFAFGNRVYRKETEHAEQ